VKLSRLFARRCLATLAAAAAVTALTLVEMNSARKQVAERGVPSELAPLLETLDREGVEHVVADYWLAYRITFETEEEIIATSSGFVRYVPHDRLVRSDPDRAYAFVRPDPAERRMRGLLMSTGYRRVVADRFIVYVR
jgi:hypothetical protein